jgi:CheY-like chemotaxis protein
MPNENILIVDDEEINLKILINYLLSEGYDADTADNGKEAVRKNRPGATGSALDPLTDGWNTPMIMIIKNNRYHF